MKNRNQIKNSRSTKEKNYFSNQKKAFIYER